MVDNYGDYGINWGNVVTDPAEQRRILSLATGAVDRNEQGSGLGAGMYGPGTSRESVIRDTAYSYFPHASGSAAAVAPGAGPAPTVSGGAPGAAVGAAPVSTPYGAFTPPDPSKFADDPLYKFTLSQDLAAVQNSAAARGSYFTPNTMQGLTKAAQNDALAGYQQAYSNALGAYTANRDTNAQNFGQATTTFNGNLAEKGQAQNFGLAAGAQAFNQGQTRYENGVNANQTSYDRARQAWIDAGGTGPLYGGYSQPGAPMPSSYAPSSPYAGYPAPPPADAPPPPQAVPVPRRQYGASPVGFSL